MLRTPFLLLAGCLVVLPLVTDAQQPLPRGQMPDLGRPTKKDDPLPTFDFEKYFVGKWTFEWDVPESVLGPEGRITGTEIVKPGIEGRYFESEYEGQSPQGAFKGRAQTIYHAENKVVTRFESDSRGFSVLKSGAIGGDLGGYYTIYYESAPFTHQGKVVRLKTTTMLLSPVHYRVRAQISVDGEPFTNYGNPWWKKDVAGVTGK
jgi:hypothetical protein